MALESVQLSVPEVRIPFVADTEKLREEIEAINELVRKMSEGFVEAVARMREEMETLRVGESESGVTAIRPGDGTEVSLPDQLATAVAQAIQKDVGKQQNDEVVVLLKKISETLERAVQEVDG